ncbi:MAG: class I SAM-dependent RNA methyltransferase [Verrucomicrobiota bacterium]|nr:class I SAM-dependent RNA methyltransferase [Verrucomicrobiota bacterium]
MAAPKQFNPHPFTYHQEIDLEITTLTNLGDGLGRHDGWVIMVPFALPGELVRVRIWKNHKNHSDADLIAVVRPSPERITPQCPLFGVCGGCQYQHLSYSAQLDWKRRQVSELMQRMAGLTITVESPHPSPKQYGYRSKLTPHFGRPTSGELLPIGFLRNDSPRLVDVPQCPIATPAINSALGPIREQTRIRAAKYTKGGTLLLRDTPEGLVTDMNARAKERIGEITFEFPAGEFFQNNPFILPEMVQYVISQAKQGGMRFLVDAYCGSGVFSLCGHKDFETIAGVEISAKAIAAAQGNAQRNEIRNCYFVAASAEAIFAQIGFPPTETAVILDPPRDGCDPVFLKQLFDFGPSRVVYVSCDPATQARDLKLCAANGYTVTRVQPFDLFPQTRHIESVATLVRQG